MVRETPMRSVIRGRPYRIFATLAAVLVMPALAGQAAAHTKSTSYSNWRGEGAKMNLSFTVPLIESARLNKPGETQPPNERVENYLAKHLSVTDGDQPC